MQLSHFDTDSAPPEHRLALFGRGAVDFRIAPVGSPSEFRARWRLLRLGDVNAVHSSISAVRYHRDAAMIARDGVDRIAIHVCVQGVAHGRINGEPVRSGPGCATVWDLSRPLDMGSDAGAESLILPLPRHMIQEVLPASDLVAMLPAGRELAMAADQLRYLLDHAAELPEAGAAYYGRALRDLFAVALLTTARLDGGGPTPLPTLVRINAHIDEQPGASNEAGSLGAAIGVSSEEIARAAAPVGGLAMLIERRRLLAAYRLLLDPTELDSVSAIAHRCGFADLPRFSRRFRDVFQTSPRDLRRFRRGSLPHWAGAYHVERNYDALLSG